VGLFQRITTPFGESEQNGSDRMRARDAVGRDANGRDANGRDANGRDANGRNAAGEMLRERRHQLRLDLDAVAEALCIKPVYLAAIEQGRTEELPGPTYAIGFIRAYASYLGLDGERVLEAYREERTEARTRPDLTLPVPLEKRGVPGGRVLLTGLVLALCGYGAWYYVAAGERERPDRVAAVPAELQLLTTPAPSDQTPSVSGERPAPGAATVAMPASQPAAAGSGAPQAVAGPQFGSGVLNAQQQETGSVAPSGASPAAEPSSAAVEPAASDPTAATSSAAPSGNIDIRALADSWVQIRDADQEIVFARVLKAGETYRVPRSGLVLRTDNAGALEVLVDGKPAPALGALGTLRRNVTLEPAALRAGTAVRG
jgi:cytoskeleton protein RodZ